MQCEALAAVVDPLSFVLLHNHNSMQATIVMQHMWQTSWRVQDSHILIPGCSWVWVSVHNHSRNSSRPCWCEYRWCQGVQCNPFWWRNPHRVSGYRTLVLFWGKIAHWVEEANLQYRERLLKLTRNACTSFKLSFVHHVMESAGYRPLCPVRCLWCIGEPDTGQAKIPQQAAKQAQWPVPCTFHYVTGLGKR